MVFNVNVINHTQPAISVNVADGGQGVDNQPVSYSQIRQSLGISNYNVKEFFLYASSYQQLAGTINYNSFDATGTSVTTNVVNAVDPYQNTTSLNVDLSKLPVPIILNGFSNFSSTILANSSLQINLRTERVTNSFGLNLSNFDSLNKLTQTEFFGVDEYGSSLDDIRATNKEIEQGNFEDESQVKNFYGGGVNPNIKYRIGAEIDWGALLIAAGISYASFYLFKKYYK